MSDLLSDEEAARIENGLERETDWDKLGGQVLALLADRSERIRLAEEAAERERRLVAEVERLRAGIAAHLAESYPKDSTLRSLLAEYQKEEPGD